MEIGSYYAAIARRMLGRREKIVLILFMMANMLHIFCAIHIAARRHYRKYLLRKKRVNRRYLQDVNLDRLVYTDDLECIDNLRMDRRTFTTLCAMLRTTGRLKDSRNIDVEEMVAMFLNILAHHIKNRVIKFNFLRSGETVSRHFNRVLNAVIRLQAVLLKKPEPVLENSTDGRWKWFKASCISKFNLHINVFYFIIFTYRNVPFLSI